MVIKPGKRFAAPRIATSVFGPGQRDKDRFLFGFRYFCSSGRQHRATRWWKLKTCGARCASQKPRQPWSHSVAACKSSHKGHGAPTTNPPWLEQLGGIGKSNDLRIFRLVNPENSLSLIATMGRRASATCSNARVGCPGWFCNCWPPDLQRVEQHNQCDRFAITAHPHGARSAESGRRRCTTQPRGPHYPQLIRKFVQTLNDAKKGSPRARLFPGHNRRARSVRPELRDWAHGRTLTSTPGETETATWRR